MRHAATLIPLALTIATSALAQQAPDPTLQIDVLLPSLITGLKHNLPDAYSLRDLTVCEPRKVKLRDGRPVSWVVSLALNSKTTTGGYSGLTAYTAVFKDGRVSAIYTTSQPGGDPFNQMIYNSIMRRIANCRPVAQTLVQALLDTAPAF